MNAPTTVEQCVAFGTRRLAEAGISSARHEARLLLAHALGLDPVSIIGHPERPVRDPAAYRALLDRRAAREPLSHLTGRREFWSLEFEVTAATLDPRPDSETLVETSLSLLPEAGASPRILDLGTGTGCLLLALLSERKSSMGVGVDIDERAVAVARRNARRLGLAARASFAVANWGRALDGVFDLVISNPPYIPAAEIARLQPEVANFEPRRALDGGPDGLDAYRVLALDIGRLLKPGGAAVLECGPDQGDAVASLMAEGDLIAGGFAADLGGRRRCLVCRKREIDNFRPKRGWKAGSDRLMSRPWPGL